MRTLRLLPVALVAGALPLAAQPGTFPLDSAAGLKLNKVAAEAVVFQGRKAIRVTEWAGVTDQREDRLAILPGTAFRNGRIEVDLAAAPTTRFPWPRLRKESPEMYESYVDLVPTEWTKVKIEVSGVKARLYVHGNEQPTLVVNDLKLGETTGAVALWIGPGTLAHFSNLRIGR
jgi:hypothetical protein